MAQMQYYIQLFFLCILSTIAILAILTRKKNKNHLTPPSPPSLPIIGHLHLISELPHQSFHKLSTQYGPIMQLYLGSKLSVVLSCPEIIKEFLKTKETYFSNRFRGAAVNYLSYGSKGFLFAPYGNYWKFMKKKCMSELLGGKTIDQFCPLRQQETLRFLRVLQKKGEAGEAIDVGGELLTLTNRIITRMTMSKTFYENDSDEEDIRKMVQDSVELAGKFNVVIKEHQEERKKRKENGEAAHVMDLLDILLEIQEDESSEINITRENVKAFILDVFLAGTDTSSTTIEWALAELINNPDCFQWKVNGNGIVNMKEKAASTLQRAYPLMCVPIPRFNCFSLFE
ncbi:cytochrome P450 93A3 [Trifolium repens]|nr:cytochrome P450 93A3 [Trifolium repens]